MKEIEKLKEENEALRRKIYGLEFDLEAARSSVTNAALEGPGYYLFCDDGEIDKFPTQREAWLYQLKIKDEGVSSVLANVISHEQGVDQHEAFECPPRPSNDPDDVRNAV